MSRTALDNKNYIIAYAWRYKMLMHSGYAMVDFSTQAQYQHTVQEAKYVTLTSNRGRYCESEEVRLRRKPEQGS